VPHSTLTDLKTRLWNLGICGRVRLPGGYTSGRYLGLILRAHLGYRIIPRRRNAVQKAALLSLLFLVGAGLGLYADGDPRSGRRTLREAAPICNPQEGKFLKRTDLNSRACGCSGMGFSFEA